MNLHDLPPEILAHILSYLPAIDLVHCQHLNSAWNFLAQHFFAQRTRDFFVNDSHPYGFVLRMISMKYADDRGWTTT